MDDAELQKIAADNENLILSAENPGEALRAILRSIFLALPTISISFLYRARFRPAAALTISPATGAAAAPP